MERSKFGQIIHEKPAAVGHEEILAEMIREVRREIDAVPAGEFQSGEERMQNPLDD